MATAVTIATGAMKPTTAATINATTTSTSVFALTALIASTRTVPSAHTVEK